MAVDTILLCFCEDGEVHGGNPQYAPPLLLEAIGNAKAATEARLEMQNKRKKGNKVVDESGADREERLQQLNQPLRS